MTDQKPLQQELIGHFYLRGAIEDLSNHFLNLRTLLLNFLRIYRRWSLETMPKLDPQTPKGVKILCSRVCALVSEKCLDDCDGLHCVIGNGG